MTYPAVFLVSAAVIAALMVAAWRLSIRLENVGIVDVVWGLGFVLVAWVTWLITDGAPDRKNALVALVTIWGLRLSGYLALRNRGKREDRRYAAMRKRHGERFPQLSLYTVFLFQGLLMWIISLPLQIGQVPKTPRALTVAGFLGILVWAAGMFFETVGDWQLARFKRRIENEGRVMDRGLWRYTRHPNYFGEFLVWWGIFLVAAPTPPGPASIVSPVLMTVLLMRVSGVPVLERSLRHRRPGYEDYARRTNAFFPGPPRDERDRNLPL